MKHLLIFIVIFGLITAAQAQTSRYEDPSQKYEDDVRANPDSAEAWYRLGEFDRQGFTRGKAREAFMKAIELKPDYAEAYNGLGLWFQSPSGCGNTYLAWKQEDWELWYGNAIKLHKIAIQLKPNFTEAYVALGNAHRRLKQYEETVSAYEQAVKLNSSDTDLYQNLAETYEKLERFDEAISFYQRVINQSKDYQNRTTNSSDFYKDRTNLYLSYHRLADLYRKLSRYQEARDTYKQIIQLKIDSADTHYGLGLTFINLGDKKSAQLEYNTLVKFSETENFDVMRKIITKQAAELLEQIKK